MVRSRKWAWEVVLPDSASMTSLPAANTRSAFTPRCRKWRDLLSPSLTWHVCCTCFIFVVYTCMIMFSSTPFHWNIFEFWVSTHLVPFFIHILWRLAHTQLSLSHSFLRSFSVFSPYLFFPQLFLPISLPLFLHLSLPATAFCHTSVSPLQLSLLPPAFFTVLSLVLSLSFSLSERKEAAVAVHWSAPGTRRAQLTTRVIDRWIDMVSDTHTHAHTDSPTDFVDPQIFEQLCGFILTGSSTIWFNICRSINKGRSVKILKQNHH